MLRKLGVVFIISFLLVTAGCRISGRVLQDDGSGNLVGIEGITVTLSGNVPLTTITNSSGYYEFNNMKIMSNSYLVEPMSDTLRFNPMNKTVAVKFANVTNVDFNVVKGALETYRKAIPIRAGAGAGTGYQMKIKVGQSVSSLNYDLHLGGKCKTDFSDIRFTSSDGKTMLGYWIESVSGNTPNRTATIWVKVLDNLDADTNIYIYYGDIQAASASSGGSTFDFYDGFESSFDTGTAAVANAATWQNTPTYDGSGQTIHPDVIYIPGGFAGYTYWMATTPYPGGNDDYENPSLLASHDGINWVVPAGLTNPLVGMPVCDHNNDADLIYNTNTNELWVYYQETRRSTSGCGSLNRNYVKLIKVTAGMGVSAPITLIDQDLSAPGTSLYLSPAVVQVDASHFYLWLNNASGQVFVSESFDGINWGVFQTVNLGDGSWHLNVTYVPEKDEYWMIYMPAYGCTTLNWAVSDDGINWTPYKNKGVLAASTGWDSVIYRGTVIYNAATDLLKIWYSTNTSTPHTGYVTTDYSNMLDLIALSAFDGWNVNQTGGSWSTSNDRFKRGSKSGKLVQTSTGSKQIVYKPFNSMLSNFILEWDFYDDMDDTAFKLVRMNGSSTLSNQTGLGVYTVSSVTNYAYHINGYIYTATSVARTNGWHTLGMKLKSDSSTTFIIDGNSVAGPITGPVANCGSVSVEGYHGSAPGYTTTTFYVDDIRVRKAADTEPSLGVAGSETEGSWDIY